MSPSRLLADTGTEPLHHHQHQQGHGRKDETKQGTSAPCHPELCEEPGMATLRGYSSGKRMRRGAHALPLAALTPALPEPHPCLC